MRQSYPLNAIKGNSFSNNSYLEKNSKFSFIKETIFFLKNVKLFKFTFAF